MNITEFSTFYKIDNINEDMKSTLEIIDDLSFIAYNGDRVFLGGVVDHNAKTLRIPKGYGLHNLNNKYRRFNLTTEGTWMPHHTNSKKLITKKTPYQYQTDIKSTIINTFQKGTQGIIDLPTGKGKTMTALFILAELNVPVLIVVKDNRLKDQWINDSFVKNTNMTYNDVCVITGASSIPMLESITKPYPIYIATHAALRAITNTVKFPGFNRLLMKMGVGMKIIDEFDLEFRNIVDIDLHTSIRYNLYLTATVMKSSKSENAVFQKVFNTITRTGSEYFKGEKPNRDCIWVNFKSHPTQKERCTCYNYADDFSAYKYNDYLFNTKRRTLIGMIRKYINEFIHEYDADDKCLIYCEKIDSCEIMVNILHNEFNVKFNQIGVINTSVPEDVKRLSLHKKFIISTIKSCGRALDIPNLTYMINLENYASISTLIHQGGRVGRVGGKRGKMVSFIDRSFIHIVRYNKGKEKELEHLFDETIHKNYDSVNDKYIEDILLI